jgi:hypothetical protein
VVLPRATLTSALALTLTLTLTLTLALTLALALALALALTLALNPNPNPNQVTTARYQTPLRNNINQIGLFPDIKRECEPSSPALECLGNVP